MGGVIDTPKAVLKAAVDDNITGEAAKAAYYFFLSLFPLIMSAFALTGMVGGERAFEWGMDWLRTAVPEGGEDLLAGYLGEITGRSRPGLLSIGLLLTVWAASNFFAALGEGLDKMYGVRRGTPFWKRRLKALLMLALGGVLLVAGVLVIIGGPMLVDFLGLGAIASLLRWPLAFALIIALMWLTYRILPNRDQTGSGREMLAGALVATVVWMLGTAAFNYYVANIGSYDATYGSLGAVIVLMLWLFLTAVAVLLGGEVAHVLEAEQRRPAAGFPERDPEPPEHEPRRDRDPGRDSDRRAARLHEHDRNRPPRGADGYGAPRPSSVAAPAGSFRSVARQGTGLAPLQGAANVGQRGHWRSRMATERNDSFGTDPFTGSDPAAPGNRGYTGGFAGSGAQPDSGDGAMREAADQVRDRAEQAVDTARERIEEGADNGKNRLAGKLDAVSDRLEERGRAMEARGGVQARAGHVATRASAAMDDGAEYLRDHDFDEMRDDLERQIRQRPLASVGIALGAGFLLARIIR